MPRLSAPEAARRRRRIIDAALRCFSRSGIHQTSMQDLYEEAQVSAGSVYTWFDSKDDIIVAAYEGTGSPHADWMAEVLAQGNVPGSLVEVLRRGSALFDDDEWAMRSRVNVQLWGEALVNPRIAAAALADFSSFRQVFAEAVARGQERGEIQRDLDPTAVGHVVWALYLGLEAQRAWEPDLDRNAYMDAVAALLTGTFTVPADR